MQRNIGSLPPCLIQNALLIAVAGLLTAFATATPPEPTKYPPVNLRGYGTVRGTLANRTIDGKPGSVLAITCVSVDNAKLTQAKYLSDLDV